MNFIIWPVIGGWSISPLVGAVLLLGLVACSEPPPEPPAPPPPEVVVATPPAAAGSTSVPDAASVLGATSQTRQDPTAGRSNKSMSRAEESTAMPMPGQNNDHSAPLPPARRASSP